MTLKQIQETCAKLSDELDRIVGALDERYDSHSERWQESEAAEKLETRRDILAEWRDQLSDIAEEEL